MKMELMALMKGYITTTTHHVNDGIVFVRVTIYKEGMPIKYAQHVDYLTAITEAMQIVRALEADQNAVYIARQTLDDVELQLREIIAKDFKYVGKKLK